MSKVIKLDDQVYDQLDQLRGKGETFSEVVEKLLGVRDETLIAIDKLTSRAGYAEWKSRQIQDLQAAVAGRDSR